MKDSDIIIEKTNPDELPELINLLLKKLEQENIKVIEID